MKKYRLWSALKQFLLMGPLLLTGCVNVPSGVQPVGDFNPSRYLGTWYEIARMDHSFERGLINVSATYTLRDDGGIDVLNRGFDSRTGKWKQARGRAYFVGEPHTGHLKVSFFGPFFGSYLAVAVDREDYSYAMVCGPNRSYLWILSRNKMLSRVVLDELLTQARGLGFDTDALIFVEHEDLS